MKHLTEEDLVLLYYSEPEAPAHGQLHLRDCPECRGAAESLALTLNVCSEWVVPEPDAELGRSVWAQIAPQLEVQGGSHAKRHWARHLWGRPRPWLWVAPALLALLLGTFYLGRVSKRVESPVMAGLSNAARQRILAISLADHLDRAEMLLTEISNAGDSGAADISSARYRAQDMVDEGRLMRQSLAEQGDTATLALVDEVERFLLEMANSPDNANAAEVQSIRQRIDSGSLLFKVRIIESNLRTEGQKS
ncbi:MAG: hypothetical protein QOJ99_15 [Bryobacterales bacterium]|jgi:hypothetical protein|nr:hypothetical protein [Bryobacterales bacterium]